MSITAPTQTPQHNGYQLIPGVSNKQALSAAIGNLIEWFDWNAYAFLAVFFAPLFFPSDTGPLVALLGSFGIMAIGFIVRPVAGLIIGYFSDKIGRKPMLLLTIYGMGLASLAMALAPTYEQIGFFAPIILLIARIIQGIAIGGEYGTLWAFAVEISPRNRRGRVAAIIYIFAAVGQITVALLVFIMTLTLAEEQIVAWGWRLVFLIGAALSLFGIWMRRHMSETQEAESVETNAEESKPGILGAILQYPKQTIMVIGFVIGFTAMVYAWGAYMTAHARTAAGLSSSVALGAYLIATAISIFAAIGAGRASDHFGRKPTMVVAGILLTIGTVPAFHFIDSFWTILLAITFGSCVLTLLQTSAMVAMAEMFSKDFRAAGMGFPYQLTVGLVGGTIPMVATEFVNMGVSNLYPWYLAGLMAISTLFYLTMKETAFESRS